MPTPYQFDPTGTFAANRISGEQHVITAASGDNYHFIVPTLSPFFADGLIVSYRDAGNNVTTLAEGIDYHLGFQFIAASRACAKPIYGGISFLNLTLTGVITLSYQTVGGNWTVDAVKINEILSDKLRNPKVTSWEQISGVPTLFPVVEHEWNLQDLVGMSDVVESIDAVGAAVANAAVSPPLDYSGYVATKYTVGLGNVQNYGVATDAEAQAGTSITKYITPRGVRLMVESVNYNFADINHTHTEYAPVSHTHSQYAPVSHTHSQYAPLESPGFTGVPVAPTATAGTSTTQIATTAFVQAATIAAGAVPDASTTVAGKIMIASAGDTTSTNKAVTPAAVASGLAAKADTGHSHAGYAANIHAHAVSDVTGLQAALDGKVTATYVSDRLAEFGGNTTAKLITDWNSVTGSGWYQANEFAANAPIANWCIGTAIVHNSEWQTQEVWGFSSNDDSGNTGTWRREKNMNVWSDWHRVYKTGGEIASAISALNTYVTTGTTQTVTGEKTFTEDLSVVKSSGEAQVRAVWTGANPSSCYLYNTSGSSGLYDSVEGPIVYSNKATNDTVLRGGAGGTIQFQVGSTNYGNVSTLGNLTMTGDAYFNGVRVGQGPGVALRNVVVGSGSYQGNTSGTDNTAVGATSLNLVTEGDYNTGVGSGALAPNTIGYENTAVGAYALGNNLGGNNNTAVGFLALRSTAQGWRNVAVGNNALFSSQAVTYNVAVGYGALYNNTIGDSNTAVGDFALSGNVDYNYTAGFGKDAQVTGSNQIQIGSSSTTTYVYGTVQNRSDLRDKTDIRDTVLGLDFIEALRPVDYKWDMRDYYRTEMPAKPVIPTDATPEEIQEIEDAYKASLAEHLEANKPANLVRDGSKKRNRYHHGLIAQEVKALLDEKGIDFGGYQDHKVSGGEDVLSIGYDELIAPLIKAVQELSAQNNLLAQQLAALTARVDELANK